MVPSSPHLDSTDKVYHTGTQYSEDTLHTWVSHSHTTFMQLVAKDIESELRYIFRIQTRHDSNTEYKVCTFKFKI